MFIRQYKETDIPEISRLYYNTVHCINSRDYSSEQIQAWAPEVYDDSFWRERFQKYQVYVAEENGMITGFTEFAETGEIDCFYVHHEWQGKGVGSRLMERIESEARNKKVPRLIVDVSITAKPFFQKMGFVIVREQERFYRGYHFKQYHMEKLLEY